MVNGIISILRIAAFINLIGWMLYMGVVMNAQSSAVKLKLKCAHCGNEFEITKKELEDAPYKLIDNQVAYQIQCPNCHETDWQMTVRNFSGNTTVKTMNANRKMWQHALWIAILPAIFAVIFPAGLMVYVPGLVISLIVIKIRNK